MFSDLVAQGVVCCPETGVALEAMEPWLFAASATENLYPVMGSTPILHADNDRFLEAEILTISRALAQWPEPGEVRDWYFSRYSTLASPEVSELDTTVGGEGYPGFWQQVEIPEFVAPLVATCPEQQMMDWLAGQHFDLALDLGCGQGGMLQYMAPQCAQVLGLEQNFYLAALANQQLRATEIPVRYLIPERGIRQKILAKQAANNALVLCGDVSALPFAQGLFDWVRCGHFLDLVDDPIGVLEEVTGLLKPQGWLTLCTPLDVEQENHFEGLPQLLEDNYTQVAQRDGVPWLRFNHKRRLVLHEDWLWAGRRLT